MFSYVNFMNELQFGLLTVWMVSRMPPRWQPMNP